MEIPSAKKSCLSDDEKHNDTIYLFKAEQPGFKMLTLKEGADGQPQGKDCCYLADVK